MRDRREPIQVFDREPGRVSCGNGCNAHNPDGSSACRAEMLPLQWRRVVCICHRWECDLPDRTRSSPLARTCSGREARVPCLGRCPRRASNRPDIEIGRLACRRSYGLEKRDKHGSCRETNRGFLTIRDDCLAFAAAKQRESGESTRRTVLSHQKHSLW